jgi:IS605 OrfB family transposase
MRLTVQVQLLADADQRAALQATLALTNQAANLGSEIAWQRGAFRTYDLQQLAYGQIRALGLSAQPAVRVIKKVADAYKLDRRTKRTFRADAAQPYDDRCLSWQPDQQTVSIWTVAGRLKGIRFAVGEQQRKLLAHRKGESDLVHRNGKLYLYATCEVPEASVVAPNGFVGVDLGIVNVATTSDGTRYAGKHLNRIRHRNQRLRAKLQHKGTKSAKRLLKQRCRKEARFAADTNHVISKRIVAEAERTGRGIALEDLQGLRGRVRLCKSQRATLHTWSFHQLGSFIAYKALRAGVVVIHVNPGAYLAEPLRLWACRPGQPPGPSYLPLPVVRLRWARRLERSPQHRRARWCGLGCRQPAARGRATCRPSCEPLSSWPTRCAAPETMWPGPGSLPGRGDGTVARARWLDRPAGWATHGTAAGR